MIRVLNLDPLEFHRGAFPKQENAGGFGVLRKHCARKSLKRVKRGMPNANDPTADPQAAAAKSETLKVAAHAGLPAKARRLHAGLYDHTKKAELCHA